MRNDTKAWMSSLRWDGAKGKSRQELLSKLQGILTLIDSIEHIPPSVMIPENRLQTLIHQALAHQRANCLFHNTLEDSVSLFSDHHCDKLRFPSHPSTVLSGHTDEVWFVSFSKNHKYLASASKDHTVILWNVPVSLFLFIL
jgi:WD40 repeat protein